MFANPKGLKGGVVNASKNIFSIPTAPHIQWFFPKNLLNCTVLMVTQNTCLWWNTPLALHKNKLSSLSWHHTTIPLSFRYLQLLTAKWTEHGMVLPWSKHIAKHATLGNQSLKGRVNQKYKPRVVSEPVQECRQKTDQIFILVSSTHCQTQKRWHAPLHEPHMIWRYLPFLGFTTVFAWSKKAMSVSCFS